MTVGFGRYNRWKTVMSAFFWRTADQTFGDAPGATSVFLVAFAGLADLTLLGASLWLGEAGPAEHSRVRRRCVVRGALWFSVGARGPSRNKLSAHWFTKVFRQTEIANTWGPRNPIDESVGVGNLFWSSYSIVLFARSYAS